MQCCFFPYSDIQFDPITVTNNEDVFLFATNDETTLEYDMFVTLTFNPFNDGLISAVEGIGEYVRDAAIVNIIDNDRTYEMPFTNSSVILVSFLVTGLEINFAELDYLIEEGANLSTNIQFRNNQNQFTIIITPVNIKTAESLGLGVFLNDTSGFANATEGIYVIVRTWGLS